MYLNQEIDKNHLMLSKTPNLLLEIYPCDCPSAIFSPWPWNWNLLYRQNNVANPISSWSKTKHLMRPFALCSTSTTTALTVPRVASACIPFYSTWNIIGRHHNLVLRWQLSSWNFSYSSKEHKIAEQSWESCPYWQNDFTDKKLKHIW